MLGRSRGGSHAPQEDIPMKTTLKLAAAVLVLGSFVACETQKVPAETAYRAAETAWAAVSAEATKFAPDQAKAISETLAKSKAALANGEYSAVIKDTTDLPTKIADVAKTVAAKKDEWTAAWTTLAATLGGSLTAVQAKVDELGKAKKLPAGVEKAAVEGAQTTLTAIQTTFNEAKTAFQNADYEGALAGANKAKADLVKVVTDLKLDMPVLAESGKALAESATQTIKDTLKK
jgi:hypothetical protein